MNDKEVYEYREQVRQYIDALGKNPEEELPLVTIEEMRAWINDFEEESQFWTDLKKRINLPTWNMHSLKYRKILNRRGYKKNFLNPYYIRYSKT